MLQSALARTVSFFFACILKPLRILLASILSTPVLQALVASTIVVEDTAKPAPESPPRKSTFAVAPVSTVDLPLEDRRVSNGSAASSQDGSSGQQEQAPPVTRKYSFAHKADVGHRQRMEDRTKVADLTQHAAFAHCQRAGFFAVFDGHAGIEVAEHLSTHLLSYFLEDPTNAVDPLDALRSAVLHCEADVLERGLVAGSTALVALLVDSDLYVANVGDSRAVLSRRSQPKPDQLTTDHKPLESGERQRLEQAGANISCDGYICGEIAVARALGSPHLKNNPRYRDFVICEPELKHVHLAEDDDFLILATDGLWDAMTNEQVVNRAKNQLGSCRDPLVCAEHLVDTSVRMRQHADNVSVVVVLLHDRPFTLRKGNSMLFKNLKRDELRADSVSSCSSAFNSPRLPVIEQQPGSSPEPGAAPSSGLAQPAGDAAVAAAAAAAVEQPAQGNGASAAAVNGVH